MEHPMSSLAPCRAPAGVTLVELVVGLAIFAVLLALAVPSYARFAEEQRLLADARRLSEAILLARSEAIKRNGVVILCAASRRGACGASGHWHDGWMAFEDSDGDGVPGAGEALVPAAEPSGHPGITIVGNRPVDRYLRFTYAGSARLVSGALQMGTFVVCKPGLRGYRVVLANSGRTRIEKLATPCP
jgi:type IV fimbrial biogenesis protein FimT